jgi:hypothetical protein
MSKKTVFYDEKNQLFVFECPHCDLLIQVSKKQTNCCIFRHGAIKENLKQVDPHLPKEQCDTLFDKGLIWGCGKPFQFHKATKDFEAFVDMCEYI